MLSSIFTHSKFSHMGPDPFRGTKGAAALAASSAQSRTATPALGASSTGKSSSLNLQEIERRTIVEALAQSGGDHAATAKKLGISERALAREMKEYGIESSGR